jgi:hypothetical protein
MDNEEKVSIIKFKKNKNEMNDTIIYMAMNEKMYFYIFKTNYF